MPDGRPSLAELIERSRLLKEQAFLLLLRSNRLDVAIQKAGKELENVDAEDMPHKDENESAAELVRKLTGSPDLNAEELIEDPETRRLFIEMKEREAERKREAAKPG